MNVRAEKEMAEALERWESFAEIEKQKREWDRGERNPLFMKRAKKIIDNLNGRRFCLDNLSERHFDIYFGYLALAAKKAGYRLRPDLMKFSWFVYDKTPGLIGWDESR